MRSWNNGLGVVGTIYEEEPEDLTSNSKPHSLTASPTGSPSSPTPPSSSSDSPLSSLRNRVDEWSRATGLKPNVLIRIQDQSFNLHKEPLTCRSRYLRHRLPNSSPDVPVPLPSVVTADAFTSIAAFCYGSDLHLTPCNVAALHVAAECLQMEHDVSDLRASRSGSLLDRTEWYFCQAIAAGTDCATLVLRKCIELLPSGNGTAAFLAGRCLEALGGEKKAWVAELASTKAKEFEMIVVSMNARMVEDHDVLYAIVDRYLECRGGELDEEEKNRIWAAVDCKKLTRPRLVDLVQNPRIPLRFVVQAMLIEQFRTRTAVIDGISKATPTSAVTLGDILQREAALRQVENLRAAMTATSFRIRILEEELEALRRRLKDEEEDEEKRSASSRARSSSFRLYREDGDGSEKGRRGFRRMVVSGIAKVWMRTARADGIGSMSCRGDGDVWLDALNAPHRGNRSLVRKWICFRIYWHKYPPVFVILVY